MSFVSNLRLKLESKLDRKKYFIKQAFFVVVNKNFILNLIRMKLLHELFAGPCWFTTKTAHLKILLKQSRKE